MKNFLNKNLVRFLAIASLFSVTAVAEDGSDGMLFSLSGMALGSSTQQGGQGPSGSSILTHMDLLYDSSWWALGGFMQYDMQGSTEKDIGMGPKLELRYSNFYIEGGYLLMVSRNFTDRAIAQQTGNGWYAGIGVRFNLSGDGGGLPGAAGGLFFQASYKYRVHWITKQDGTALSERIQQADSYPVFGLGYAF